MMKSFSTETTVGEIVRADPARSRVFENLGIDDSGAGRLSLAEACQAKGLDPASVVALLAALDDGPEANAADPDPLPVCEGLAALENDNLFAPTESNMLIQNALARAEDETREPSSPVCYANEFKDW